MEQDDGLHIKQESVNGQNETLQIKEECILQWDDSPGDVQIKEENDDSKTCTFNADDQNETFQIKKECISQYDENSSILQLDDSTGYCQIKEEHKATACECVIEHKTEQETGDFHEGKLAVVNNKFYNFEGDEDNNTHNIDISTSNSSQNAGGNMEGKATNVTTYVCDIYENNCVGQISLRGIKGFMRSHINVILVERNSLTLIF